MPRAASCVADPGVPRRRVCVRGFPCRGRAEDSSFSPDGGAGVQERAQLSPSPGGFRNSPGNEGRADRTLGFAGSRSVP